MINTVIFDLDGLLIDSEYTWYLVFKNIYKDYGYELSMEDYLRIHSGKTLLDNIKIFKESYPVELDIDAGVQRAVEDEAGFVEQGIALKDGALELLHFLNEHGYKIVLGTSSKKDRALKILKYHNIHHFFDDFVVGYEVKRSKPFPDVFLTAAEKVGSKPENCLVLEDSEAGIQAAWSGNIPVICIPDLKMPGEEHQKKTAAILPSLRDVIGWLKEYGIE